MKSNLKHELRTPLNHIIGYCEMLIEEAEDRRQELLLPDLRRIHTAGQRLLGVVNDLFDARRTAAERMDEQLMHHEVRTPLNQIIGYTEILQEDAIEGGQDTFIPDLQRIHEAAQRLLTLIVDNFGAEGFSVSEAERMSEKHPTTFIRTEPAQEGERATALLEPVATPGVVLVVDDDEGNREMLARRLERLGHRVTTAANGREAIDLLQDGVFDLMLLDIMMPELNGYQVLEHLHENPELRGLPVIVLSASDDSDKIARCIGMGAEDYLPKPFDPVLLQARIGASLEKKRLRDREVSHLRQIEAEKKRSDDLLHVILPADVAAELKAKQVVQPRRFDGVAVLFCDVVGFTAYCDRHTPEDVLMHLQALVEAFELLTAQHGLEKIKTIGDSFMATGGLLTPTENPALSCVRCGLAMIDKAAALPAQWKVRVGIHCGPVIAGVVGQRKYQYDIWGDTVNTAARMEAVSAPGTVCVNTDTWKDLSRYCRGRSQGTVTIKGKGEQEIFHVDSLIADPYPVSMSENQNDTPAIRCYGAEEALSIIQDIFEHHFPDGDMQRLRAVFSDIRRLFAGEFPGYQACDTPFHDLNHTCQAAVATARIVDGHLRAHRDPQLTQHDFERAICGILLHDIGFLKEDGDHEGTGAKHTHNHVQRSAEFAAQFLPRFDFDTDEIRVIQNAIYCTDLDVKTSRIAFHTDQERFIGNALGAGDILGQMAAPDYPDRLPDLYREFSEAGPAIAGPQRLYQSAADLMQRTRAFYRDCVQQILHEQWNDVHLAMAHHFSDGQDHYAAAIAANLTRIDQLLTNMK